MTGHRTLESFPVDGWRSATSCGPDGGNCVEVNLHGVESRVEGDVDDGVDGDVDGGVLGGVDIIGIRDSKSATGTNLAFRPAEWRSFLSATIMDNIGD